MKFGICIICLCLSACASTEPIKITGNSTYTQSKQKTFSSSVEAEQRVNLYEHPNKSWITYFSNKLSVDRDHFGKEIKTNVFTTFGIDF